MSEFIDHVINYLPRGHQQLSVQAECFRRRAGPPLRSLAPYLNLLVFDPHLFRKVVGALLEHLAGFVSVEYFERTLD